MPPGLHHLHRRLPGVHARRLAGRARTRRSPKQVANAREDRWAASSATRRDPLLVSRALGGQVLDARDDGHRPQPRAQRPEREGPGQGHRDERFAYDSYRRFISMYGRIVLGLEAEPFDQRAGRRPRSSAGAKTDADLAGRGAEGAVRAVQGHREGARPASRSRRTRPSSSGARSRRCSRAGTAPGPSPTASGSASATTSAPRSTSRRWCSATGTTTRAPASASPATRPRARTGPTATSWSTRRARTWSPASGTPRTSTAMARTLPGHPRRAAGDLRPARAALPGHVRHGVHHRAGQALDAADPGGQAHRRGRAAHGGRHDQGDRAGRKNAGRSPGARR